MPVLATQTLIQKKSKSMLVSVEGKVGPGVTAKDIVLAIIGYIGTAGGTGYANEFGGEAIRELSGEGRMTVCNMAIEAGARAGFVGVDEKTIEYVRGRPYAPKGALWDQAVAYWRTLQTDDGALFDRVVRLDATEIQPQVTWGTSPEMVVPVDAVIPDPGLEADPVKDDGLRRALAYMGLEAGTPIQEIRIDKVFIGSRRQPPGRLPKYEFSRNRAEVTPFLKILSLSDTGRSIGAGSWKQTAAVSLRHCHEIPGSGGRELAELTKTVTCVVDRGEPTITDI